jgi:hypothetical protein
VLLGLDDLRDDDLGEHGGHAVLLFHFQPRHGEQMPKRSESRSGLTKLRNQSSENCMAYLN